MSGRWTGSSWQPAEPGSSWHVSSLSSMIFFFKKNLSLKVILDGVVKIINCIKV